MEQLQALGLLAATQFIAGRLISKQFSDDKDWHWDKPFGAVIGSREYSIRSVPGDIYDLVAKPRIFLYNRLSPITRVSVEAASGRDIQGRKATAGQQGLDALSSFIPMTFKLRSEQKIWEKALESAGLHSKVYQSPADEMMQEFNRDRQEVGGKTEAEQAKSQQHRDILKELRQGDTSALQEALKAGDLSATETKRLLKSGQRTPRASMFASLPIDEMSKVWDTMSDTERREVRSVVVEKAGALQKAIKAKQVSPNDAVKENQILQRMLGTRLKVAVNQ
jgi:hypothetical protein